MRYVCHKRGDLHPLPPRLRRTTGIGGDGGLRNAPYPVRIPHSSPLLGGAPHQRQPWVGFRDMYDKNVLDIVADMTKRGVFQ